MGGENLGGAADFGRRPRHDVASGTFDLLSEKVKKELLVYDLVRRVKCRQRPL